MSEVVRWFPLDRIEELQGAIAGELRAARRTRRRDAIAVALGLHGMRVGEVARATVADFFAAARTLYVPPFKRGRARRLDLHSSLVDAIAGELAGRRMTSPRILCTCSGRRVHHARFQQAAHRVFCAVLGPDHGLTFHALRHTFAMRIYAATKDLSLVQRMLGHRSIQSTEVYARSLAEIPEQCLVQVGHSAAGPDVAPPPGLGLRVYWGD